MIHVFRTKEKINLICQEIVAWFQREKKVSKYKNSSEATEEINGNVTCLLHQKEGIFQKGAGIHIFHSFLTNLFNLCYNMEFKVFNINGCMSLLLSDFFFVYYIIQKNIIKLKRKAIDWIFGNHKVWKFNSILILATAFGKCFQNIVSILKQLSADNLGNIADKHFLTYSKQ